MRILTREEFDHKFEELPQKTKLKFKSLIENFSRENSVSYIKKKSGQEGEVYYMRVDFRYRAFFTVVDDTIVFMDIVKL